MIKEIIKYSNKLSKEFDAQVKFFDDSIKELIQDLKDTIVHNGLDGLSAYQIGNAFNVIVIKKDDELIEMINPNIYSSSGKIKSEEKTQYFNDVSAVITRHEEIKVLYEDINKKTHYLTAKDNLGILIQRKVDYTLGGTIRYRLNEKEQDAFDLKLEYGSSYVENDSCPTTFVKDKILNFAEYLIAFSFIILLLVFFLDDKNDLILQSVQKYSMLTIVLLSIIYFFYSIYENSQNKSCSSCQVGNVFGNIIIVIIKLIVLFALNYFIFK